MTAARPDTPGGDVADSGLIAVAADLSARLGRGHSAVTVGPLRPFGDGHSGFSYALELEGRGRSRTCVLRLSPPGVRIAGPTDIGRQGRIMGTLSSAGLPAPEVIDCDSSPVLDGRAFALMELVEGVSWEDVAAASSDQAVAAAAIVALHRIQSLSIERLPIDEPPLTPLQEVERWLPLIQRAESILQGGERLLVEALRASVPPAGEPVLVHGDYHYANLLFSGGEVNAVVDWEIAGLGEPLVDLGCLAVATLRRRAAPDPNPTGSVEIELPELVASYGAEAEAAAWFIAASCLKYVAIIAYNLDLHRRGRKEDAVYERLQRTIGLLIADGTALLDGGLSAISNTEVTV